MGERGLPGATISQAYDGSGVNHICYGLLAREIEVVNLAHRSAMSL